MKNGILTQKYGIESGILALGYSRFLVWINERAEIVFGINEAEEIKKKFKELSLIHHPDKGGNKEKFLEIINAKNECLMKIRDDVEIYP